MSEPNNYNIINNSIYTYINSTSEPQPMRVTPPPLLVRSIQGGVRPYTVRKGPVRSTQQFR